MYKSTVGTLAPKTSKAKEILRSVSRDYINITDYNVLHKLNVYMNNNERSQGISAPQLGFGVRVFMTRFNGILSVCINPKVIWSFGRRKSYEGCESLKSRYHVKRPILMKVQYTDLEDNVITKILTYKKARIFEHELDHLNGIMIDERSKTC